MSTSTYTQTGTKPSVHSEPYVFVKPDNGYEFRTDASLENLQEVRAFIDHAGKKLSVDEGALSDLRLAVDEAVTNIVQHGYAGRSGPVEVLMYAEGMDVHITVRDHAPSFSAENVRAPQLETEFAERPFGGMGVFLIDRMTDRHEYRSLPGGGNELLLLKKDAIVPSPG